MQIHNPSTSSMEQQLPFNSFHDVQVWRMQVQMAMHEAPESPPVDSPETEEVGGDDNVEFMDVQENLLEERNIAEASVIAGYNSNLSADSGDIEMAGLATFDSDPMDLIAYESLEESDLEINTANFARENLTTTVALPKKFLLELMDDWDTNVFMRQVYNENYVADDSNFVYVNYQDPLVINCWEEWAALNPYLCTLLTVIRWNGIKAQFLSMIHFLYRIGPLIFSIRMGIGLSYYYLWTRVD